MVTDICSKGGIMANVNWNAIPEDKRPKKPTKHERKVQAIEEAKQINELNHQFRMKLLDKIKAGTFTDEDREIMSLLDKNCLAIAKLIINL